MSSGTALLASDARQRPADFRLSMVSVNVYNCDRDRLIVCDAALSGRAVLKKGGR